MEQKLKKQIKIFLNWVINWVALFMRQLPGGNFVYSQIISNAMGQIQEVNHVGVKLMFSTPNALNKYRADSFSTKEPETLKWIDAMPEGSILWDIGANVGLYTCYAAKKRGCRVFAFEPSVFNLELLARNIVGNGLTERVTIVPLPLTDRLAINTLNMTSTEWGGALSTFGQNYGQDGQILHKVFEFQTIGVSMVDAINLLKVPLPDFIKLDVDGIEHLILSGGGSVLKQVRGVLIELPDVWKEQTEMAGTLLRDAGLKLVHSHDYDPVLNPDASANQIWTRTC